MNSLRRFLVMACVAGIVVVALCHLPVLAADESKPTVASTDAGVTHECVDTDVSDCLVQCDRGNASSCAKAGYAYQHGEGVPVDMALAVKLVTKSCDAGDMPGCTNLGRMYMTGDGVRRDVAKGLELTQRACDAEVDFACENLGGFYAEGKQVPKSPKRALMYYDKACVMKTGGACRSAGILLKGNWGLPKDSAAAVEYFKKACDLNDGQGCVHLSDAYYLGDGVPEDNAKALEFAKRSCRLGLELGCVKVTDLGGTMVTPADIRRAEIKIAQLFQQCSVNKSRIEAFRVAGITAARNGDKAGAARATERLQSIEPGWARTLDDIRQTITVLTNDEGPRFQQLMVRVHRECSCDAVEIAGS